jgi:hypothetical protein
MTLALLGPTSGARAPKSALQSVYIGRWFTSDDVSSWNAQVLEVVPQDDGVRVRMIRLSLANRYCDGLLVQAGERVIPHTTVPRVAGVDVCTLDKTRVDGAVGRATRAAARWETAKTTVVANCAGQERVLSFPYDTSLDWKSLERSNPPVAKAAMLFYQIRDRAFGRDFSFEPSESGQRRELERLGTAVVPDLLSERFETFLGSMFTSRLKDYSGPPSQVVLPADLLEREQLTFETYVPVSVPLIAMVARVFGDVRLALTLDRITGAVTEVQAVSGPALLSEHAASIVRGWRFAPASLTGDHLEISLRFQHRCN